MSSIRIRKPFAVCFVVISMVAAFLGLSTSKIPQYGQSDKGLHFVTFFLLTLCFYWILETSRRRCIHLSLLVCTAGLGIGSEFLQAVLPNGRDFDPFDILANVVGSALALVLCSGYHRRMLERRRKNKNYDIVPGEEPADDGAERDLELGTLANQEDGVISVDANGAKAKLANTIADAKDTNVTEELDNWDENAEDWDEEPSTSSTRAPDVAEVGVETAGSVQKT